MYSTATVGPSIKIRWEEGREGGGMIEGRRGKRGAGGAHRGCGGTVVSSDNGAEFRCRECGHRLAWPAVR